jgi:hypothetical protein
MTPTSLRARPRPRNRPTVMEVRTHARTRALGHARAAELSLSELPCRLVSILQVGVNTAHAATPAPQLAK